MSYNDFHEGRVDANISFRKQAFQAWGQNFYTQVKDKKPGETAKVGNMTVTIKDPDSARGSLGKFMKAAKNKLNVTPPPPTEQKVTDTSFKDNSQSTNQSTSVDEPEDTTGVNVHTKKRRGVSDLRIGGGNRGTR